MESARRRFIVTSLLYATLPHYHVRSLCYSFYMVCLFFALENRHAVKKQNLLLGGLTRRHETRGGLSLSLSLSHIYMHVLKARTLYVVVTRSTEQIRLRASIAPRFANTANIARILRPHNNNDRRLLPGRRSLFHSYFRSSAYPPKLTTDEMTRSTKQSL